MITGSLIKKMREDIGMTQQQLADTVGITQAHIAKIENEKVNPTLLTINKILSVLRSNNKLNCEHLGTKKLISASPEDPINKIVKLMRRDEISQIPIIEDGKCVGSVTEKTIIKNFGDISDNTKVKEFMEEPFPIISCGDDIEMIKTLLEYHQAVLVSKKGRLVGIVTKSDLLSLLK
jgi:predicted transcriptional regulator